jgi:engulfment/cell motility protein 1
VTAANTGFGAIKPALDQWPTFLESLVQRLSASDHALCASALHLVNALMRDAVANGGENEWPKFIKRLQDLGVIGGVGMLMRGEAAVDMSSPLAGAILEFQGLTKILLRKWRSVKINTELSEHKRALKTVHLLSRPEKFDPLEDVNGNGETDGRKSRSRHHPEKWRRLGFETENPAWEFEETGYLGIWLTTRGGAMMAITRSSLSSRCSQGSSAVRLYVQVSASRSSCTSISRWTTRPRWRRR